jgi:hypothetical protein
VTTIVQDTSAPKAGRRFEPTHELVLHDVALSACASLPGAHRGVHVIREMVGPIGIPDLTALVGDSRRLQARLALDVPPLLNQIDAGIASVVHANVPRSSRAISRALGWPIDTITRRISGLFRIGALIQVRPDRYVRPAELAPIGRVYAVEAKVRDRVAAIQQARSYGAWADSYVLVMGPLGLRPREILLDEVISDHGGLIVDGEWLRRPTMRSHSLGRRLWTAEHFVAGARAGGYQPSVLP